jgi:hypothetical protein
MRGVDIETGEFYSLSCRALSCVYCIETHIWQTGLAFELAAPERYAVFTQLAGDWPVDRAHINALHKRLDRKGFEVRSAYTIEKNPKDTGFHLNFWWHGSYIPQDQLSEAAVSMGWGPVVHVKAWRTQNRVYGFKEASGSTYGMKEASGSALGAGTQWHLSEAQAGYLARNGGKLLGARRSFWRDGPGGVPLGGKASAIRACFRSRGKTARAEWVVYAGSEVLAHSRVAPLPASVGSLSASGSHSTVPLL